MVGVSFVRHSGERRNPGENGEQATRGLHPGEQKERYPLYRGDLRSRQENMGTQEQYGGRFYETLWNPSSGMVRDARYHGVCDRAGEEVEGMETGVETGIDRD